MTSYNYNSVTNWVSPVKGTSGTVAWMWNGPICKACNTPYVGTHECRESDLQRRIDELQKQIDELRGHAPKREGVRLWQDELFEKNCPCRKENGGSGVCGCTLGGTKITC